MARRKRKPDNPAQLALDFEQRINNVIRAFAANVRRKGPRVVARELGVTRVAPHWRKIGGGK